jgi:hypothetical protein
LFHISEGLPHQTLRRPRVPTFRGNPAPGRRLCTGGHPHHSSETRWFPWRKSVYDLGLFDRHQVVLGELRRRRWRQATIERAQFGRALPGWPIEDPGPERRLQQREAWALLTRLIDTALTPRQQTALVAHAFQGMPLDLLAEWLGAKASCPYRSPTLACSPPPSSSRARAS